jgi:hypothetical protein
MLGDVGVCGNDLLFWRKFCRLLELEIANGSREREVSIDTTKVDESTSSSDT